MTLRINAIVLWSKESRFYLIHMEIYAADSMLNVKWNK